MIRMAIAAVLFLLLLSGCTTTIHSNTTATKGSTSEGVSVGGDIEIRGQYMDRH